MILTLVGGWAKLNVGQQYGMRGLPTEMLKRYEPGVLNKTTSAIDRVGLLLSDAFACWHVVAQSDIQLFGHYTYRQRWFTLYEKALPNGLDSIMTSLVGQLSSV